MARSSKVSKPSRGKYLPLYEHLLAREGDHWPCTFSEIEQILGVKLPASAYRYPAWWANEARPNSNYKRMWVSAGWRTTDLDLEGRRISFVRVSAPNVSTERKRANQRRTSNRNSKPAKKVASRPTESKPGQEDWQNVTIGFSWTTLGAIEIDNNAKLVFPKAAALPAIYRIRIHIRSKRSVYVGEAQNLRRRFGNYRTPGPSQRTSLRINGYLLKVLRAGGAAYIDAVYDDAWAALPNGKHELDFSKKHERVLFEHAALVLEHNRQKEVLNR